MVQAHPVALMIHVMNRNSFTAGTPITRGNPLGNPFVIGKDGDRAAVIEKYRWFLWDVIRKDCAVSRAIRKLAEKYQAGEDIYLICCCKPLDCHGDVIARAIVWYAQNLMT